MARVPPKCYPCENLITSFGIDHSNKCREDWSQFQAQTLFYSILSLLQWSWSFIRLDILTFNGFFPSAKLFRLRNTFLIVVKPKFFARVSSHPREMERETRHFATVVSDLIVLFLIKHTRTAPFLLFAIGRWLMMCGRRPEFWGWHIFLDGHKVKLYIWKCIVNPCCAMSK